MKKIQSMLLSLTLLAATSGLAIAEMNAVVTPGVKSGKCSSMKCGMKKHMNKKIVTPQTTPIR